MEACNDLERTNCVQLELAEESGQDMIEFIEKYAEQVRKLIELGIYEKESIRNKIF